MLFLNHLSTIIGVNAIEEIASVGESRNISYKNLTQLDTAAKSIPEFEIVTN